MPTESGPQTWHHGLVAEWWEEFNDDFRSHEITYFREFIEDDGQPALDVDGCDVSADMMAACRRKAASEGLEPNLYVQPMHALDLERSYRTIFVCGSGPRSRSRRSPRRNGAGPPTVPSSPSRLGWSTSIPSNSR
jgi:hypothetical protein